MSNRHERRAHAKKEKKPVDSGYPFETGDWVKWSNRKRLDWQTNFRNQIRDNYKEKFGFTDADVARMSADVEAMERVVAVEESNPELVPGFKEWSPADKLAAMRQWCDELSANDYEKARLVGWTPEFIDDRRAVWDDWERQVAEHERKKEAKRKAGFRPGETTADLIRRRLGYDDSVLLKAMEENDEETVNREWGKWMDQVLIMGLEDRAFGDWFMEFHKDQTDRHIWADTMTSNRA